MQRVLGCNQSKCPWYSFVCSVAPENDQLPLMLSSWCSIDLLMIFFIVSPLYTDLHENLIGITNEYQKTLLVLAKNDAKHWLRNYNIEVNDLSQCWSVLSDSYFETIERIANITKEKEYVKKRSHLIEKYQNLTKGNKIQTKMSNLYLNLLFWTWQIKRYLNIIWNF